MMENGTDNRIKFMLVAIVITLVVAFIAKWSFYASIGPLMADYWSFVAGVF